MICTQFFDQLGITCPAYCCDFTPHQSRDVYKRQVQTAVAGAEDDPAQGAVAVDAAKVEPRDTVVGITASGRTPYVLGAVKRARELGALTVGLSCDAGSALSGAVERPIEVLVGPEVLSGSTRLKSGTAQKLVLNMISTIVMVRMGCLLYTSRCV